MNMFEYEISLKSTMLFTLYNENLDMYRTFLALKNSKHIGRMDKLWRMKMLSLTWTKR